MNTEKKGAVCASCSPYNHRFRDESIVKRIKREIRNGLVLDASYISERSPFLYSIVEVFIDILVYRQTEILSIALGGPLVCIALLAMSLLFETNPRTHVVKTAEQPVVKAAKPSRVQTDDDFNIVNDQNTCRCRVNYVNERLLAPAPLPFETYQDVSNTTRRKKKSAAMEFASFHDLVPLRDD
jgi:hypothetical protein